MNIKETFTYDDFTLSPRYSELESRSLCDISINGFTSPLVMANMDLVATKGMIEFFIFNNMMATVHRYFKSAKSQLEFVKNISNFNHAFFSVGSIKNGNEWIDYLATEGGITRFMVDMAHGNSKLCVDTVKYIKDNYNAEIAAGNVVTPDGVKRLQDVGAKYIKIGIASGAICSTQTQTGFGIPQASAVYACSKVANKNVFIIADGGVKTPGDICKAINLGSHFVMTGRLLAGTSLASGTITEKDGKAVKQYRGMASREARDNGNQKYASVEGISTYIPYVGKTEEVVKDIHLNLQASLAYGGVTNWKDFKKKVKRVRVTPMGFKEKQHLNS